MRYEYFVVAAVVVFTLGLATVAHGEPPEGRSPIGTNLNEIADWSTEWPFVDAMKFSRPWISGTEETWDDGRAIDLDANGWPRSLQSNQIVHTLMFRNGDSSTGYLYPGGRYHVLYDGEGELGYRFDAHKNHGLSTPGHDVVDVTPSENNGINLQRGGGC